MLTPKYLLSKNFHKDTIIALVLFSVIFIFFFRPFGGEVWFSLVNFQSRNATISFYASAVALITLSRAGMYQLCTRVIKSMDVIVYVLWLLVESALVALLYMIFAKEVMPESFIFTGKGFFMTFLAVTVTLGMPVAVGALLGAFMQQRKDIETLRRQAHANAVDSEQDHLVHFYDTKGDLKFSILGKSIYFIAAQDNYVQIFYDDNSKMKNCLLRSSIQSVEKTLDGTPLVRCHRSYIVNLDHVQEFLKGRGNSTLVLDDPETKAIPVSKTYAGLLPVSITGRAVGQIW